MKHSDRSGFTPKNLKEKGYYIVLFLCILAVGVSGYLFISTAMTDSAKKPNELSVPVTADKLPQSKPAASQAELPAQMPQQTLTDEQLRLEARKLFVPPLKGEVLRSFSTEELSYNPTTRDWRLHAAVDLASEGGEVFACMAGTVTEVYDDVNLGTTVVVTHDGGYESLYGNLTAMPVVDVGDLVDPGDLLGAVGGTAMVEAADAGHLHFAMTLHGEPIDPMDFWE